MNVDGSQSIPAVTSATAAASGERGLEAWLRALAYGGFVSACLALTAAAGLFPEPMSARLYEPAGMDTQLWQRAWQSVLHAMVVPGLATATLAVAYYRRLDRTRPLAFALLTGAGLVAAYVSLAQVLSDWMVDDAAITFAYSENLATGHGLVLHPRLQPEEAYSTTSWMLLLAGLRWFGLPIDASAKLLNVLLGAITLGAAAWTQQRLLPRDSYTRVAPLLLVVPLSAPFIVWSVSGLEHTLQALLLLAVVAAAAAQPDRRVIAVSSLTLLTLTRPEAPLIVAAVFAAYALHSGPALSLPNWLRHWPIAVVPAVAYLGLLGFRLLYFGAPFPNPYYAKASEATFLRLLNPGGSGWHYVIAWLSATGFAALLPFAFFLRVRRAPLPIKLALAIVLAQLVFVVFAGGDWMSCYRFIAPILPLLAILLCGALPSVTCHLHPRVALLMSAALACFLALCSAQALVQFRYHPTTPTAVVTHVGQRFSALADALQIREPTLAHHDAGGTSYRSPLTLVDLAGLGNRTLAQHMDNPGFVRDYLLEQVRPCFVFGTAGWFAAAASGFHKDPRFERMYVRLEFVDDPLMRADLSHIRRDLVKPWPGLEIVRGPGGEVERVRVARSVAPRAAR